MTRRQRHATHGTSARRGAANEGSERVIPFRAETCLRRRRGLPVSPSQAGRGYHPAGVPAIDSFRTSRHWRRYLSEPFFGRGEGGSGGEDRQCREVRVERSGGGPPTGAEPDTPGYGKTPNPLPRDFEGAKLPGMDHSGASLELPSLNDEGLLPVELHVTTLDEIERVFVREAPFSNERALIFDALRIYARLVWARFPEAVLWVDGGFVTHKDWAPPKDVDVTVVLTGMADYDPHEHPEDVPLWTLMDVSAGRPSLASIERVQPMGGLVDGFYAPGDNAATVTFWTGWWKRLSKQDGQVVPNAKGFVEVRNA